MALLDVSAGEGIRMTDASRLARLLRLEKFYVPEPNSGCWLWIGFVDERGYGHVWWDGKCRRAHREMYSLLIGPIDEGMALDHLCRVRSCVNPAHLEQVSHRENCLRGVSFSAANASKVLAPCGHPYTYIRPRTRGGRECRPCRNLRARESLRRRKIMS